MPTAALRQPDPAPDDDLSRLFRDHGRLLFRAAYRVTGNAEDAEDVLQTVFLRLARREGGAPLSDSPTHYLHRAAVNAALDVVRSRRAARKTPLAAVEPVLAEPGERAPDRIHDASELARRIRRELASVSPKSAEIFVLRYFEGYDNHEIARMVGSSRSTVGVILHRVRHRLRETIGAEPGERS